MSEYPEHDKLSAVRELSQAIGEFIEFGGYTLCEYVPEGNNGEPRFIDRDGQPTREAHREGNTWSTYDPNPNYESWNEHFSPVYKPIDQILAEYFKIDLDALEREKRDMLEMHRITT